LIQSKHNIYFTISTRVCSDVSFIGTIFSRNWHFYMVTFLISDLTCVFLLLSLSVSDQSDISKIFFSYHEWKQLFTQKCAINYQTYLENQMNNFWSWNNSMLMKYPTADCAGRIIIIWAHFWGQVLGNPRLTAFKLFLETVCSSDHNSNLKRAILGTQCAFLLPRRDLLY
jgi:hypothetical protein